MPIAVLGPDRFAPGARQQPQETPQASGVRRLILSDFRSYASLDLEIGARTIVLTGDNGTGKTNVLEALSLLTPGRGLRRAELRDCARSEGSGGFAVSALVEAAAGRVRLGTGVEPSGGAPVARKFRIDREPAPSIRAFCEHVRVVWLTPAMDGLFMGPPGDRRRFLDRMTLSLDADHGARVNALERALRSRNRLLEERGGERWLEAVEREAAEIAVAVGLARQETVQRLGGLVAQGRGEARDRFPVADLRLEGEFDRLIAQRPALEAEDAYRRLLREARGRDAAAGRTLTGPHSSDLIVRHGPALVDAARSSTGEQKALLVGLVLAQARLVKAVAGVAPLVLLDEIAAHFDPGRRATLYRLLGELGAQLWLTGADPAAFAELSGAAQILKVTPGVVAPA